MKTQRNFEKDVQAIFNRLIPNPYDPRFERKRWSKGQLKWRRIKRASSSLVPFVRP